MTIDNGSFKEVIGKGGSILVVDDDRNSLDLLSRIIKSVVGKDCLTATSGEAAMEYLSKEPVSILITDYRMPGMTGAELIQEARAINPRIQTIIVTANEAELRTGKDDVRGGETHIDSGTRVIAKPIDVATIQNAIESALERARKL